MKNSLRVRRRVEDIEKIPYEYKVRRRVETEKFPYRPECVGEWRTWKKISYELRVRRRVENIEMFPYEPRVRRRVETQNSRYEPECVGEWKGKNAARD